MEETLEEKQRLAEEERTAARVEASLTERYGAPRTSVSSALRWLWGQYGVRPSWLDHVQYRYKDGKRTFTAALYRLHDSDMEEMLAVAKRKNLSIYMTVPSNYNSGTMLVIMTQKEVR